MQTPDEPTARALKPSANREKLLRAARRLMAEKGFAATSTEEIVRNAGVTRGALYYQFADKRDLFRSLCEMLTQEIAEQVAIETMKDGVTETEELNAGASVLLDLYSEPEIRQILLLDGPAVLGWDSWRALQEPVTLELLSHALEHLVEAKRLDGNQVDPLAHLLFGALCQAGIAIAKAEDPDEARIHYRLSIEALLSGIGADVKRLN